MPGRFAFRMSADYPCRSCRRLRSFDLDVNFKKQDQKIAACGSSYIGRDSLGYLRRAAMASTDSRISAGPL
ncbi:hypothetical protein PS898_02254 [Pseudomonas fluorescens]|nr:hypothetical protein PS898_02254 [Pseudomonas fluorescens]